MDDIQIELIYAESPTTIWHQILTVPSTCCVEEAIKQTSFKTDFPNLDLTTLGVGIFGQKASLQQQLKPNDRIELCRQLTFDPKESRKRRAIHRKAGILKKKHLKPDRAKKIDYDEYA
ncbi:electron transporter [Pelistega indica]|uniref:UPF0125 protein V757_06350 n=1 Tax=Pelistega indica TaxID=1414851 RepID=V8G5L7_9BURK|nr:MULTISPECIES: RnfH family protein [Pelistega]ETD71705.1 electron transporter [Pelistega indica]